MNERKTLKLKKPNPKAEACNRWLHTFPVFNMRVPMAIGIREVIRERYDAIPKKEKKKDYFNWVCVQRQLRGRTRKDWYRQALRDGVTRHTLEGEPID